MIGRGNYDKGQDDRIGGTVFTVDTRPFWREPGVSPKDDSSHWHNNGETLYLISRSMGDDMVKILGGK